MEGLVQSHQHFRDRAVADKSMGPGGGKMRLEPCAAPHGLRDLEQQMPSQAGGGDGANMSKEPGTVPGTSCLPLCLSLSSLGPDLLICSVAG